MRQPMRPAECGTASCGTFFAPLISNLVIENSLKKEALQMECPTAQALFEDLSAATMEYFYSADKLSNLVGSHDQFVAAQQSGKQANVKWQGARLALEKHRLEHCGYIAI